MDVFVSDLKAGMILSEDVFSDQGELILGAGVKLSLQNIDKLIDFDVLSVRVVVHEAKSKAAEPLVTKPSETQVTYEKTVERFHELFTSLKFGRQIAMEEVEDIVSPLVDQVLDNKAIATTLWQLESCDLYTFDHSVAVSLTSALLARWLNCDENTIRTIAVAGLLHDIGKVNVPDQILNKPSALTDEEMKVMKTHATLGYVLLMNQKAVAEEVLKAVLQHHERYDGNGYPSGLKAEAIHPIARIVAVADVFSAMTTKRVYREATNPFTVAKQMLDESYGYLDPKITQVFLARISNYYVGNVVKLSDGRVGEVVMVNRSVPHRPLVRVEQGFVDLFKNPEIDILELIY